MNPHPSAAITLACIVLRGGLVIPAQSDGLWDPQMKAEMEMRSGVIASCYQHFSLQNVAWNMVDAHLRGKYADFMNTNGCSQ